MHYNHLGWEKFIKFAIVCSILLSLLFPTFHTVTAQDTRSTIQSTGNTFVVVTTSDDVNGNTSSPTALLADPGPDGISLPEAIDATNHTSDFYTINFDPSLSGSTIYLNRDMPHITQGNVTINGDINKDGTPDITIDGTDADFVCFNINGASNVVIRGFNILNFHKHGVYIFPNSGDGRPDVENILIYQNEIVADAGQISLLISDQDNSSIRNVEINSNYLHDGPSSVSIIAGMGTGSFENEISNVSILNNTIDNPGQTIDIMVSPAASSGAYGNTVTNIGIRGNTITGENDSSILVDASNQGSSGNNTLDGLLITDNYIEGIAVGIELVGESGGYSTGNLMTNVEISDNTMIGCGIHIAGSTGYNSHGNTISNLIIERNYLNATGVTGSANGIYVAAGADGSHDNFLYDLIIRDNFITGFKDTGILLHANDAFSPNNSIDRVTILNQTITNNAIGNSWASAINVNTKDPSNTITNVTIKNSIFWGNGGGDAIKGSITPEIVTNNIINDIRFTGSDGNFYSDPLFVDATNGNNHLQASSPGIDTGDSAGNDVSLLDLDHNTRVVDGNGDTTAVVDLGAWEYGGTAVPEISFLGKGEEIFNNDIIPATWDGTDFGAVEIEGTPKQATFTLQNTGDNALELTGITPVEVTGPNAADFTVVSQPDILINGGESTTFTLEFSPSASGLRSAILQIPNTDSDESQYSFAVQGIGEEPPTPPEITVLGNSEEILNGDSSPSTTDGTDFGNAMLSDDSVQKSFTIQNLGESTLELTGTNPIEITGENAADFYIITQPNTSIGGGLSSEFTIEFNPIATGLREATVQIENNDSDEGDYTFAIQGYAPEPQEIAVSGNGLAILDGDGTPSTDDGTDFGNAVVGGASVQTSFTIENTGEVQLELNGDNPVEITGFHAGDFTVITAPSRLINGGQSTSFTIEFTPSATGSRLANVIIPNTDSDEGMFSFAVQGNGAEPPTEQEIAILGNGIEINNGDSSPSTTDHTDFSGAILGGGSVQRIFTIQNSGESTLLLTGSNPVTILGDNASDFSVIALPSTSIEGGSNTTFTIKFTPSASGQRTASIQILNNDNDESAYTFVIRGEGLEPPEIAVSGNGYDIADSDNSPSSLDGTDFGNVVVSSGATAQSTFTIENLGDAQLTLSGTGPIDISGPNAGDFLVTTQANAAVNGGQSTSFTIEFTPSETGFRVANVSIPNNDSDEGGFSFQIQGNGQEPASPQEIVVQGNGINIADGDNTPSALDGTDFGDAAFGGDSVQVNFTIMNTGETELALTGSPLVEITGTNADDFAVTVQPDAQINGGASTTFTITFTPSGLGYHEATIHIPNTDANEGGFNFRIQGNGVEEFAEEYENFLPIFLIN